jgi:hypothetical protein
MADEIATGPRKPTLWVRVRRWVVSRVGTGLQLAGGGMAVWAGFGINEIAGRVTAAVVLVGFGVLAELEG